MRQDGKKVKKISFSSSVKEKEVFSLIMIWTNFLSVIK